MLNMPTWSFAANFPSGALEGPWLTFDDPTRGKFDTGVFAGDNAFVDLTTYVQSITCSRGVSSFEPPYRRAEAGRLTVMLRNDDARFDPSNADGPYQDTDLGLSALQPNRPVRITATLNGTYYPVWQGYADSWTPDYTLSGKNAVTLLQATDLVKILANTNLPSAMPHGAGECTYNRIVRIADNAGIPETDFVAVTTADDLGNAEQPSYVGTALTQASWQELQVVADTAYADLYIDATGKLAYRHRNRFETTSQYTFGDQATDLGMLDFVFTAYDDQSIFNEVHIKCTNTGSVEQVSRDTVSQSVYGIRTFSRTDFPNDEDVWSAEYAAFLLATHNYPVLRFSSFTIDARTSSTHATAALTLDIGDRVTVRFSPPGRTDSFERDCFIRGISHTIGPATWQVQYVVEDATSYNVLVFDDAGLGRLDFNRFGMA